MPEADAKLERLLTLAPSVRWSALQLWPPPLRVRPERHLEKPEVADNHKIYLSKSLALRSLGNATSSETVICLSRQVGLWARRQSGFLNEIQRTFVFDSVT
jgi:hypothetical protein